MSAVTLNAEQRLFVINAGGGYTCLGFDVVFKRLAQYASLLKLNKPSAAQVGTMEQYKQYLEAERAYIDSKPTQTLYDPETPTAVSSLLETYRQDGSPLRVFYGDTKTGRDWMEEHDVYGKVGRSCGPIKVALLVPSGANGGSAILTACIVRMVDGRTKREVYRHPQYHMKDLTLHQGTYPKLPFEVHADLEVHARFSSAIKRHNWIEFMNGRRMTSH